MCGLPIKKVLVLPSKIFLNKSCIITRCQGKFGSTVVIRSDLPDDPLSRSQEEKRRVTGSMIGKKAFMEFDPFHFSNSADMRLVSSIIALPLW